MSKASIFNFTAQEFSELVFTNLGKGKAHALDYYKALFKQGDGTKGHNPKEVQSAQLFNLIDALVKLPTWQVKKELINDEVEKYVLEFSDKHIAELVVIEMKTGLTLCVSSQVGCKMACSFCETGRMGKLRDLEVEEIIAQVFFAKYVLKKDIKNIVFMGMGEPFDNFDNLKKALTILTDPCGFEFGPARITVSTSGVVPKILEFIPFGQKGVKLAISVNGSNNLNRQEVMPINRRYNMQMLHEALKTFTNHTKSEVFAEYVMMKGVNDALECAVELANYLSDIPCIVNLIPYNAQSSDKFSPPSDEQIKLFQKVLIEKGFKVFIRKNKGDKIMAACGQLGELNLKKNLLQKANSF